MGENEGLKISEKLTTLLGNIQKCRINLGAKYMQIDFQLHRLGWKNFQQLCGTILRESFGQTYQIFSDSDDGGRDGAFSGKWRSQKGEDLKGTFTIQCKHSSRADQGLSLSLLKGEIEKARSLAARGLARNYLILTNMVVTAEKEVEIASRFEEIEGIQRCLIYGRNWIEEQIRENRRIRRLIPRLYGLGDLSQILDERAHAQARSILDHLGSDFSKFVATDALSQGALALDEHGFVLLLGEPCCGKSTIASALALGAADEWGCNLVFASNAKAFVDHWNPDDPRQFFWVDDAFGSTQYERDLALDWNRAFPLLNAALKQGTKIVFTSRSYIHKAALEDLKDQIFLPIRNSQVVIRVENLSLPEKEQILYNHVKLGTQPSEVKTLLKGFLPEIASHPKFLPETARRLADPFFTKGISIKREALLDMVQNMREFLSDTLKGVGTDNAAAVALVFMRGGNLDCSLDLTTKEERALELLGSNLGRVRKAFRSLDSTLLLQIQNEGKPYWQFKHPSIRDAFGTLIAADPCFTDIYLSNTPLRSLLTEITCGTSLLENVKLQVSSGKYPIVCERLKELNLSVASDKSLLLGFLRDRCDKEFVEAFLKDRPRFISTIEINSWMIYSREASLISRFHLWGLLSARERKRHADRIVFLTCLFGDAACFKDPKIGAILLDSERAELVKKLKTCLLGALRKDITASRNRCLKGELSPHDAFWHHSSNVDTFSKIFPNGDIHRRLSNVNSRIRKLKQKLIPKAKKHRGKLGSTSVESVVSQRSIFDDVDI